MKRKTAQVNTYTCPRSYTVWRRTWAVSGINEISLLHKRINRRHSKTLNIQLPMFRRQVAAMLCKPKNIADSRKRIGRPRGSTPPVIKQSKKTYLPTADTRFDGFNHYPEWLDRSGWRQCTLPGCKSETQCISLNVKYIFVAQRQKIVFQSFIIIII